jgi:hypothetical protein
LVNQPPPATFPCHPPRPLLCAVLAIATLAFLPSLTGGFLADDFVYLAHFRELPWSEWPKLFTHEWSGGVWGSPTRELRPFAALSLMSDAKLFGGAPLGYRLAWRDSAGSLFAAVVAGLIFAIHPAHAEAVAWITGRVDLIATSASLLFWLAAEFFTENGRRNNLVAALAALFLGLFSKELCMFVPVLLLLSWVLLDPRAPRQVWLRRAAVLGGALVLFAIYAACRKAAFGHDSIGYNLWTDDPAWRRQAAHWGWLVPFLPFSGHQEWIKPLPIAKLHFYWIVGLAIVLAGLGWTAAHGPRRAATIWFFGGLWFFLTVFPLLGVTYFSPRHLYFPTVGFAIAVGLICASLPWRTVITGGLLTWFAAAHVAAVRPWQRAADISAEAMGAIARELDRTPDLYVFTAVPETYEPVWLWAWSSPQSYGAPFLAHPPLPGHFVERPGNYVFSDKWPAEHRPLETLRAAPEAVVVFVADDGKVSSRRVARPALQAAADKLAAAGVNNESWTAAVKSLAQP